EYSFHCTSSYISFQLNDGARPAAAGTLVRAAGLRRGFGSAVGLVSPLLHKIDKNDRSKQCATKNKHEIFFCPSLPRPFSLAARHHLFRSNLVFYLITRACTKSPPLLGKAGWSM